MPSGIPCLRDQQTVGKCTPTQTVWIQFTSASSYVQGHGVGSPWINALRGQRWIEANLCLHGALLN